MVVVLDGVARQRYNQRGMRTVSLACCFLLFLFLFLCHLLMAPELFVECNTATFY